MAFYKSQEDDDQLNLNQPAPQTGPQSDLIGQGAGAQSGNAAEASSPSSKPDNPGNWLGLKQYLDANKTQAAKLGDQVAGQVQNTIGNAQKQIGGLQSQFTDAANKGQIADFGNAKDQATKIVNNASTQSVGNQINNQDKDRFKQVATAQYTGPQRLEDTDFYQPAYDATKKAQNYAGLSKTEEGSQELLRDLYGRPGYSAGQNRFDSLLLKSDDNRQKLAQSRQSAGSLESGLNDASSFAQNYAKQQAEASAALQKWAQHYLTDAQTKRNTEVQSGLDKQAAGWDSEYNEYLNLLKNSDGGKNLVLTPEQMKKLGVDEKQRIFNLLADPNSAQSYLTFQQFDPSRVISRDEQAQLAALDELAGSYGGGLQNKYTMADQAGTLRKEDALDASAFGDAAKTAQMLFDYDSKLADMRATDSQSRDIMRTITNWGGFADPYKEKIGEVNVTSSGNQTVADFLRNQGVDFSLDKNQANMNPTNLVNGASLASWLTGDAGSEAAAEARAAAEANVSRSIGTQILDYLKRAGYGNQIKAG